MDESSDMTPKRMAYAVNRLKYDELVNMFPTVTGGLRRVENEMNAVLVNYFPGEPDEDGNPQYIRAVSIACADEEMLPFLRERARDILKL